MFDYKVNNTEYQIDVDINSLIAEVHNGTPWYINKKKPEKPSIMGDYNLTHQKVVRLRESDQYAEAVAIYIFDNNLDIEPKSLGVGIERRGSKSHRHPDATKHVVWGQMVSETDDEVVIRKLPDVVPEKDPLKEASKKELMDKVRDLQQELEERNNDQLESIAEQMDA